MAYSYILSIDRSIDHISKGLPGFPLLLQLKDGFAKATTSIIAKVNLRMLTIFTLRLIGKSILCAWSLRTYEMAKIKLLSL